MYNLLPFSAFTTFCNHHHAFPERFHHPKKKPYALPTLVPWGPLMGSASAFHLHGHVTQMDLRVLARGRTSLRAVLPNCLHVEPYRGV